MLTILHVEDDSTEHELIKYNLERFNNEMEVIWASSGKKALEILAAKYSEIDAIICDYQMPSMNGLELLKIIREDYPDMPFVLFTGQGSEKVATEAFRSGVDDYYSKEIGFAHYNRLTSTIMRLCELRQHRKERDKAEKALVDSELRFKQLFKWSTDSVFILKNRKFHDCNPFALEMFKMPREQLLGKSPHEVSPEFQPNGERSIDLAKEHLERVEKEKSISFEWQHLNGDGEIFDAEVSIINTELSSGELELAMVRDISAQKKEESEAARRETFLREIIDSSNEAIFIHDADSGEVLDVNQTAQNLFKLGREEIIGTLPEAGREDDSYNSEAAIRKIREVQENGSLNFIWKAIDSEGTEIWVNVHLKPFDIFGKKLVMAFVSPTDSEHLVVNTSGRNGNVSFYSVVNASSDGLYMKDMSGKFTFVNDALLNMADMRRDAIIGKASSELNNELFDEIDFVKDSDILQSGPKEFVRKINRCGEIIHFRISKSLLRDDENEIIGSMGIIHEVDTENQKHGAEPVADDKFRLLFELSIAGNYRTTLDGSIVDCNKAFINILGFDSMEEVKNLSAFELYHDENDRYNLLNELKRDGYIMNREISLKKKDGTTIWVINNGVLWNEKYMLGTLVDITRWKTAKDEIEYQRDLQIAANQEMEAFSYSVSHDLKAPIRHIQSYAELLKDSKADQLDDEANRIVKIINNSCNRMNRLIDSYIKLSRLGRDSMGKEFVRIDKISSRILENLRSVSPERVAEFRIESELVGVGDPHLVQIILENLLNNAWKYTSNVDEAVIEVGQQRDRGRTVFFVKDNGVGFDMKDYSQLFVPFRRLHDDEEYEGSGIGLASVQRIVHRHGGRIWAESSPGDGTTFYFTLG